MAEEDAIMSGLEEALDIAADTTEVDTPVDTEVEAEEEVESPASDDTESEEEQTEAETEVSDESDDTEETEAPVPDQKELARLAYEARQAEKARRDEAIRQRQEAYLAEAEDQQELALRQLQIDAYQNRVDMNVNKLQNSYDTAVKDIEIFRNPTPEIAEYLSDALDEFEAKHISFDDDGNPIEVRGDLNQFLSKKASLAQKLTQVGARSERTAKAKQKSAITPTPTSSPKKPKSDPIMEGLLSEL